MRKSRIKKVDLIVLGAGLAGAAMAWQSHWHGWTVAIIDRLDARSSSRVAAGLVTPITGARAAASWKWDEFYPVADAFYRRCEQETDETFWRVESALRVFGSQTERELYESKWLSAGNDLNPLSIQADWVSAEENRGLKAPFGMCQIGPAARLDTNAYLGATQRYFQAHDAFHQVDLNCDADILFDEQTHAVCIPSLELIGKRIAFCQGIAARENRFFHDLPLHPARGDILLVESPSVQLQRVVHHDAWAVPVGQHRYLVGATYDRAGPGSENEVSEEKTMQFRAELIQRWESLVHETFQAGQHVVLEQRSAVRPASYDRHPLLGQHDVHANVFCLNGLGSKGTLMAPRLAELAIGAMNGTTIDRVFSRSRRKVV
ncbi:MAG: FAD-dependent oxidoreductase [Planctomycetota bacterium]|nr:FAD-dependent oxidoreductase [Planctomycetota bacterium]